ncbi:MAG: PKD domain-containing protein [Bacteroidales bacterium]|nr:PKD domain-containing protein [Bacteroidales bacterium]
MPGKPFNKQKSLDPAVVRVLLIIMAIAGIIFLYRWYNYEECPGVDFSIEENNHIAGEHVEFTCKSENLKSIRWDFGDGQTDKTNLSPAHIYQKPGEYMVTLIVNGNCPVSKKIIIHPKKEVKPLPVIPKFSCPSKVFVGENVVFRCLNTDAYKYEWNFGESKTVDATTKEAIYKYSKTGRKTITLIVNGDKKYIASKEIYVMPLPARSQAPSKLVEAPSKPAPVVQPKEPEPEVKAPKAIPVISNDQLQQMLTDFAKGKVDKNAFDPYLFNTPDKVIVEINDEIMRFSDFLNYIQGQDLNIREFLTYRENDKRITRIKIKFKRFK